MPRSRARIGAMLAAAAWWARHRLGRIIAGVIPIPVDPSSHRAHPSALRRLSDRVAAARPSMRPRRSATCPGWPCSRAPDPGRNARWTYLTADPVAVLEAPSAGPDPFAVARRLVARLDRTQVVPADAPPFLGGLVGFLGYDLGDVLERLPSIAARRPGPAAAAAGAPRLGRRVGPADRARLARRPGARRRRRAAGAPARRRPRAAERAGREPRPAATPTPAGPPLRFRSRSDRPAYEAGVERPRAHRRRRHLPGEPDPAARDAFDGDPWAPTAAFGPATRRSSRRTSIWAPVSPTGRPRALLSASPEPFLSRRRRGHRRDGPDQGHPAARPRRAQRTARSRASSWRAPRTGPRT